MAAILITTLLPAWPEQLTPQSYDVLIRNGTVVDGTGKPGFRADVGIKGDGIAAIKTTLEGTAKVVIDAAGKVVSPGPWRQAGAQRPLQSRANQLSKRGDHCRGNLHIQLVGP